MQIQLFKPIFNKQEILTGIEECLDKGWTGIGYKTLEFEQAFRDYTKLPNAHFLNSATSGLHLALEIIKLRSSKFWLSTHSRVVTTPLTFVSDTAVIKHSGLIPAFVDIDNYLCMDPSKLRDYLIDNKDVLAVIYVGMGGNTGKLNSIVNICEDYDIPLILDAAHMMGTHYHSRHIGLEADFTVFSFQATKNLSTADSGMLVCSKIENDKLARKLSWLGISKDTYNRQVGGGNWEYDIEYLGWKYHGNSIMAVMGLAGLKLLKVHNAIRRSQADTYICRLNPNKYRFIPIHNFCISSRYLFQVRVSSDHRNSLIKYAASKGVELGVHYQSLNIENSIYKTISNTPNANLAAQELVSLPIGPHLSYEDIQIVTEVLNEYPF